MHCRTGNVKYRGNAFVISSSLSFPGGEGGEVGLCWQALAPESPSAMWGSSHLFLSVPIARLGPQSRPQRA